MSCNICQVDLCKCAPLTKIEKLVKILKNKAEEQGLIMMTAKGPEECLVSTIKCEIYKELADILELWELE